MPQDLRYSTEQSTLREATMYNCGSMRGVADPHEAVFSKIKIIPNDLAGRAQNVS